MFNFGLKKEKKILEYSGSIFISEWKEKINIGEAFSREKFSFINECFKENFFSITEPPRSGTIVYSRDLLRPAKVEAIKAELKDDVRAEIFPGELLSLLEQQYEHMIGAHASNFCAENNHGFFYLLFNWIDPVSNSMITFVRGVTGELFYVHSGIGFGGMMVMAYPAGAEPCFGKDFKRGRQVISHCRSEN